MMPKGWTKAKMRPVNVFFLSYSQQHWIFYHRGLKKPEKLTFQKLRLEFFYSISYDRSKKNVKTLKSMNQLFKQRQSPKVISPLINFFQAVKGVQWTSSELHLDAVVKCACRKNGCDVSQRSPKLWEPLWLNYVRRPSLRPWCQDKTTEQVREESEGQSNDWRPSWNKNNQATKTKTRRLHRCGSWHHRRWKLTNSPQDSR